MGADLDYANLANSDLTTAKLTGAKLLGANLASANLNGQDLSGVDFTNANLAYADLGNTDLSNVNMYNAKLKNTILDNSNFYNTMVNEGNYLKIQELGIDKSNLDLVNLQPKIISDDAKKLYKKSSNPNSTFTDLFISGLNLDEANLQGTSELISQMLI